MDFHRGLYISLAQSSASSSKRRVEWILASCPATSVGAILLRFPLEAIRGARIPGEPACLSQRNQLPSYRSAVSTWMSEVSPERDFPQHGVASRRVAPRGVAHRAPPGTGVSARATDIL